MTTIKSAAFDRLQFQLSNTLSPTASARRWFAGIIGDRPSHYAKSPVLWNATFKAMEIDAEFLPFDVDAGRLKDVVDALRACDTFVGGAVTNPYKIDVLPLLDELDPKARQIGAVNTITRSDDGRLIGANTDGQGFMDMLTRVFPDTPEPFFPDLSGSRVLLLGAGGAARAVAFFVADAIGPKGQLLIANRTPGKARELADALNAVHKNAAAIEESAIVDSAKTADLVINATTKGQAGMRRGPNGVTCLEPYAALAPADPAWVSTHADEATMISGWYATSYKEIGPNNAAVAAMMAQIPRTTAFVDLVYIPFESVMLRLARLSGHRTLNGKGMNIGQAVDAFANRVMKRHLAAEGWRDDDLYARVFMEMAKVW